MRPECFEASRVQELNRPRLLKVGGVVPFTATDYPGKLAAVVFVQGCPWRCGYCHNPHLQPRTKTGAVEWQHVVRFLRRRVGLVDAVVFSGGEPTADPAIVEAIREVRALGFAIGLHSGGTHPNRFAAVLPLVDWVGLDIKAPFDDYERVTRIRGSGEPARRCLETLLASGVDYECRTTLHPGLLPEDDILRLAGTLADMGVKRYALQIFRKEGCRDDALNAALTRGYPSEALVAAVGRRFPEFTVRRG
ncbi:anaerobic ribonucleoside-triphosphate reductase activating protein [Trinickia caryophylli]|uniref:Anaerobic ribonucleoside-triphosphate reductase activating protein n=1 Tax=Trinickia caryophylli TaxID=28094 RepID=A0A1X7FSK8_TRICW|nr:anaerobic ribonucleoside-triphosphate reductase activating protein [Trinickia caryophylli]SMF58026.1 anaerobic ribonucleoside-triphosphate reductase activating protein [Trinickia caryophylli]